MITFLLNPLLSDRGSLCRLNVLISEQANPQSQRPILLGKTIFGLKKTKRNQSSHVLRALGGYLTVQRVRVYPHVCEAVVCYFCG